MVGEALQHEPLSAGELQLQAPIDLHQEVWAAGVTYERSRNARIDESGERDLYSFVYESARPELFFKSLGARVVGPDEAIGIRQDAFWSVPEPELGVVFDRDGRTLGFVVGDDVSSRDIEGTNALYLPQAKVYDKSCALGPGIVPAWELSEDPAFAIELQIARDGETVFAGSTSTNQLRRHWSDLSQWLCASLSFPDGVVLLTGTGIIPAADVTLKEGDDVVINISNVGTLRNRVVTVGGRVGD
jgi:2-dehydro-3-deoxy-D-arabinonate dehydratase